MIARLLTPEQVAERLAVTAKVVRIWLRDGKLPGLRLGRLWRVRESDLEEFIAGDGFTPQKRRTKRPGKKRRKAPPRSKKVKKAATRKRTKRTKAATRKRRG